MMITPRASHEADGTGDWQVIGDGACAFFRTDSFEASARLVSAIAALDGVGGHPPDVDVRADGVTLRLVTATADAYGMSRADVDLARRISAIAASLGAQGDPSRVQNVLVIVESTQPSEVMPFWRALLDYVPRADSPDEDMVDPRGRGPGFWFEPVGEPRPGGGRIHVAVWVPEAEAEARMEAAMAAGGRLVRDEFAPRWWTLADAAGNEADVASVAKRE
jgi:4a-hydroxytetrahydrobiopterin dehydratase